MSGGVTGHFPLFVPSSLALGVGLLFPASAKGTLRSPALLLILWGPHSSLSPRPPYPLQEVGRTNQEGVPVST